MSRNDLKHGGSSLLWIGGILLCFIFPFVWERFYTGTKTATLTETRQSPPTVIVSGASDHPVSPRMFRKTFTTSQESFKDFEKTDIYRTIIDNNLFRPLGWRPPTPARTLSLTRHPHPKGWKKQSTSDPTKAPCGQKLHCHDRRYT